MPLLKSFHIPLVKEGGRMSEQTFSVLIEVSNLTYPYQPATLGDDYNHTSFNITFPPDQQTVLWEFQLIPNEAPEENEAFRLTLSSINHPKFLTDSHDVVNETVVVINDPQSWFWYTLRHDTCTTLYAQVWLDLSKISILFGKIKALSIYSYFYSIPLSMWKWTSQPLNRQPPKVFDEQLLIELLLV